MSRPPSISRDALIQRLIAVFRESGYENTSLATLAEKTGLVKASLYHHFPGGKADMAGAVLAAVGAWMGERVFAPLRGPGAPRERIVTMTRALQEFYQGGASSCLLATFSAGEAGALFREQIRGGTNAWIYSLARPIMDAGVPATPARERAEDAIIRIQGALIVSRALQNRDAFMRLMRTMPDILLTAIPTSPLHPN